MLNNSELISIIVPVYNVERYIEQCVESIIKQTYKNIEIILVDDGSTDDSSYICDLYAMKDSRIKVIHKKNGGLSSARNIGIEAASGSLIGFVDSDDYIKKDMYEKLKNNMDKYNSDISFCSYYKKNRYQTIVNNNIYNREGLFTGKDKFINMSSVAWNKLYKKDIFNDIKYPEGKLFEDISIICNIMDKAKKVSYIDEPLYYYRSRKSGICGTYNNSDKIESIDNKINYYKDHKYLDLIVEEEYNKIKGIMDYSCIVNAKDTKDPRVISLMDEAVSLAYKLSNNELLDIKKRKDINSFIDNKDKHYKNYKFKWNTKNQLKKIAFYK